MDISKIKHLKSQDILTLVVYSCGAFMIPSFFIAVIFILFGAPLKVNGTEYFGFEAILYSLLVIPLMAVIGILVLWVNLGLGWKIARVILNIFGRL